MKKLLYCLFLTGLCLSLVFQVFGQTPQVQPSPTKRVTFVPEEGAIPEDAVLKIVAAASYDGDGVRYYDPQTGKTESGRLSQADAPDKRSSYVSATQPYANESRDSLRSIVKVGDTIYVSNPYHGRKRVSFGRPLVNVHLKDGTLLNFLVIERGWAWYRPATGVKDVTTSERMQIAFDVAKASCYGLWCHGSRFVAPWNWRRTHKYGK